MIIRSLALSTAALAVLLCSSAAAAPTTVQLRIEGSTATVFEGPVTTDGKTITKGPNTVVCDGTLVPNATPGPTATSVLDDAAIANGFDWDASFFGDFFINRIANAASTTWGLAVNFQPAQVGGCQQRVQAGDEVLFASDFFAGPNFAQEPLLRLDGPPRAVTGQPFSVKVTDGQSGAPFPSAIVASAQTGADGSAGVTPAQAGVMTLKAEAPGAIRSNRVKVCVSATGSGDCGVPPGELGTPGTGKVKDSVAPRVRIGGPRDGLHYRRGPRLLSGTAADDIGVTDVKLSLRRHVHGRKCRWWSATSERFTGGGCTQKVFFRIDAAGSWSYLLPRGLPPGRYVLDVKAFDRAGNRDERFVRGSNRVVFYVGRAYGRASATSSRSQGAPIALAVAGKSRKWTGAVRAPATLVKAGGRTCRVGARTPLAALVRFLRKQRTGYSIHDYGSCSHTSAAAAGQLFVRRIGKEANSGNDGWFYKVNDRAPELGAGDPAARLRPGDRLLWFYCVFDAGARSCQRSLRIVPLSGSTSQDLRVAVRGYDNAGHWTPVAGATVAIEPPPSLRTTTSGTDGVATLAPAGGPGRYGVTASRAGMIDAFPVTVSVK